jgi:hypothetical protein
MTVIVIPTVLLWILIAFAALNLCATLYKLHLMRRVQREKPWLTDGVVLPEDCTPRRLGAHRMDDWILCVKNIAPDAPDKASEADSRA